ncbi:hypothetical protein NC651_027314 [Populus alba x Populus x berolinensis]|nr:hypothetical protein NC651_027314 [Populus alba x Populus x berolinensis]
MGEVEESGGMNISERRVGIIYDEKMCKHHTPDGDYHPENPNRIRVIWNKLLANNIPQRYVVLSGKEAEDKYLMGSSEAAYHAAGSVLKTI